LHVVADEGILSLLLHNQAVILKTHLRLGWMLLTCFLSASVQAAETQDVFKRFQNRIVQIRILEASSGSRVALGSGFSVSQDGEIITNYHVVSELVQKPKKYRAEIIYFDGHASPLRLLNFDAVHDLAVVAGDSSARHYFEMEAAPPPQGTRAYSIGTPLDLGFTIVEGTYNGLLKESQYERIHFTGSINPGMSGGPAILEDGRVIGINVATAGEQVSFLVPAKFAIMLLQQTRARESATPSLDKLATQLQQSQARFIGPLLEADFNTVSLGPYQLPSKIAPYLKCWGDTNPSKDDLFRHLSYACSTDDNIYISGSHIVRFLRFSHAYLSSDELGEQRFYNLYQTNFANSERYFPGSKENVTRFRCQTGFVEHGKLTMRTVLCLRSYRKLAGLHDAVLKVAVLDGSSEGVQSTLELGGVSYDNALRFARKYLESIAWKK